MTCDFEDRKCVHCGYVLPEKLTPNHRRICQSDVDRRVPTSCVHFLGVTGEYTPAAKCGCSTSAAVTALVECSKLGVATFVQPAKDKSIPYCRKCPDYATE